jgi:hypothetical protein
VFENVQETSLVYSLIDNRYNGYSFFVILYADDILLITQSVSLLQDLLLTCELELL